MDCNAPDDLSWLYRLLDGAECRTFKQPPACWREDEALGRDGLRVRSQEGTVWVLNPQAENLERLPEDYYPLQVRSKRDNYVARMLRNVAAPSEHGRAVFGKTFRPA